MNKKREEEMLKVMKKIEKEKKCVEIMWGKKGLTEYKRKTRERV